MLGTPLQRIAAAVAALLIAAGVAWALGAFASERKYSACVVADVSGSTVVARPTYVEAFKAFATDAGLQGSGDLWVVLAAGNPGVEGAPVHTSVAPAHPRDPVMAPGEVQSYVASAANDLAAALLDPPVTAGGSAIAEATLQCAKVVRPGDRVTVLSDGIQSSPETGDFHDADLSPAGIDAILSKLAADDLLPDLRGVRVSMPLLIQNTDGTSLQADQQQRIVAFWRAWMLRTGATPAS